MRRITALRFVVPLCLVVPLLLVGCDGGTSQVTLTVDAAASLKGAFDQAAKDFMSSHSNVNVVFNYGGSNTLAAQIIQGANVDIFASANTTQMQNVVQAKDVNQSAVQVFAHNRLVVITPAASAGAPDKVKTLQDLATPGVKIILAAKGVPAGDYALTFLSKASSDPAFGATYEKAVLANVVSYEADVETVVSKVVLGEADAGIVYTSDAATNPTSLTSITIPDNLNVIADYPIAPIAASMNGTVANEFIAYILSSAGQATLTKYGFIAAHS
jgi:molybdate transport system substrate-binding protein